MKRKLLVSLLLLFIPAASRTQAPTNGGAAIAARPLRPGILLLAHGGALEWNEEVRHVADQVDLEIPTEVAFGMATRSTTQAAIDRLVRRHGVLSGSAACRLQLRACAGAAAVAVARRARSLLPAGLCGRDAADHGIRAVRCAPERRHIDLAHRAVFSLDRAALRRAVGERSAVAGMVRWPRPPPGAQSIRPLCRLQPWILRGTVRIPGRGRAIFDLARAVATLVDRFRGPCGADRSRRGACLAPSIRCPCARSGSGRSRSM